MATEAVRRTSARIAALTRWGRQDPVEGTRAARESFLARFEREADPNGELDPAERRRRAECLKKAHFARLGQLSGARRRAAHAT